MEMVFVIVGFLLAAVGVTVVYSARDMAKKWFSFGDQNEGVKWLKIVGFVVSIIGVFLVYFFI